MATWYRTERSVITVEYHVPTDPPIGACWNQVQQAIAAAVREFQELSGNPDEPCDDQIMIHARDESIVISFEGDS